MKTIFIANSKPLICDLFYSFCSSLELEIVAQCTNGLEAINILNHIRADIYFLDIGLPFIDGFEVLKKIRGDLRNAKVILYVGNSKKENFSDQLILEVDYLMFEQDRLSKLKAYLSNIINHEKLYVRSNFVEGTVKDFSPSLNKLYSLTSTQLRILSLVSKHKTMPQIAEILFISPHTVNNHAANIRKKLNLQGRGVLLKYAIENRDKLDAAGEKDAI